MNLSKDTFKAVIAPRYQRCSCGCGQIIGKGQQVYARTNEGRSGGESRIIDLEEHYRDWLEKTARSAALARAAGDLEFNRYLK